jgi:hypothetical protein
MNTYTAVATILATLYMSFCFTWLWEKIKKKKIATVVSSTTPSFRKNNSKRPGKQIAIKKNAIELTQDDQVFVLNLDPASLQQNPIIMTMQDEDFLIEFRDGDVLEEFNPELDEPIHFTEPEIGVNQSMLDALEQIADQDTTTIL